MADMPELLPMRDYQRGAVEAAERAWGGGMRRPGVVLPPEPEKRWVLRAPGQAIPGAQARQARALRGPPHGAHQSRPPPACTM